MDKILTIGTTNDTNIKRHKRNKMSIKKVMGELSRPPNMLIKKDYQEKIEK
jgi:hypothetical protein